MQDFTPLHAAVYDNDLPEVQKLLAQNKECNAASRQVNRLDPCNT